MEDEHQAPKSENSATPPSHQNLIIGIVMGAAVLLLLLLVISQQVGETDEARSNSDAAELRRKLEEEKRDLERRRLAGLSRLTVDPELLVAQIKNDAEALARSNQELTTQLAQYRTAAQRAEMLQSQLDQERQARSSMVDQSQLTQLRNELNLAQSEVTRLQEELQKLQSEEASMIDPNTFALVKGELEEIRKSNANLRHENQRLITELAGAKLFVTQDDLSPRAVALYRELKKLETMDHRERRVFYDQLKTQVKATVEETISFQTGSANINPEHEVHLKDLAVQAPDTSFFLVVGYASTSGDSQANEELSSQRATRVASMVNYLKKESQGVQAVYLGEGTRFGPEDAPNQVCEVWQIRP